MEMAIASFGHNENEEIAILLYSEKYHQKNPMFSFQETFFSSKRYQCLICFIHLALEIVMSEENINKEVQLIKDATDVFLTYGIKSVTMDDVAKHLRVS